jgi:hypothetical protein
MIVANAPHLWLLVARIFKLKTSARNTSDSNSQFTMRRIRMRGSFNPVGSEERIFSAAQGPASSDNELDPTRRKKFLEVDVFNSGWESRELDSDIDASPAAKTV